MLTRRAVLAGCAGAALAAEDLDFARLIPPRIARSAVYREEDWCLWDPAMVRTPDGVCHLLYSRWRRTLGFDAWATHAGIGWATAQRPEGPYRFQRTVFPGAGGDAWDAHSVYNTCLLEHGGRYYLYYTGNRGPGSWRPDRAVTTKDEEWWVQRNNQRVGVAVADHPSGPWQRFERPLIDTGPDTGWGIIATPNVCARPGGGFLMVYKTLAPGAGRIGSGVFHYAATADNPLGPFRRHPVPVVDKRKLVKAGPAPTFHIDDHLEWWQGDRYYAIVKDHNPPHLTGHGKALLLLESADGLTWKLSRHELVSKFALAWEDGGEDAFERLEMPKLYFEGGRPRVLFLAALPKGGKQSWLLAVPLSG
jgi:hypothetical protein